MNANQSLETDALSVHNQIRRAIWILGILGLLFGIADRVLASFSDCYLSSAHFIQLSIASLLLFAWLYLEPDQNKIIKDNSNQLEGYEGNLLPAKTRMFELRNYHLISQEYLLPFSFVCQIYHLLNLKHLETIHGFSLNNLKITQVTHFQPTAIGGVIKFQTLLDSPFNILRIWRRSLAEVMLVLHTPYTVELCIPVYGDKKMIVIFNALPINETEHKLCIDIYSNLQLPKFLLQILLHIASSLTLFEDLPYLQKLSQRGASNLVAAHKVSNHETMRLFKRFVELYGSMAKQPKPIVG